MKKIIIPIIVCLVGAIGGYLLFQHFQTDAEHEGDICPKCGSTNVTTIVYGLVDHSDSTLNKELESGKVVLGGCMVSDDSPEYTCNDCQYTWGHFLKQSP